MLDDVELPEVAELFEVAEILEIAVGFSKKVFFVWSINGAY